MKIVMIWVISIYTLIGLIGFYGCCQLMKIVERLDDIKRQTDQLIKKLGG